MRCVGTRLLSRPQERAGGFLGRVLENRELGICGSQFRYGGLIHGAGGMTTTRTIHELPDLHGRARVFRDRQAAGVALAGMLQGYHGSDALVLAIPAGGVPVAVEIAARL